MPCIVIIATAQVLAQCGHAELALGQYWDLFVVRTFNPTQTQCICPLNCGQEHTASKVQQPLTTLLTEEFRGVVVRAGIQHISSLTCCQNERKTLARFRLDLDVAKNKVKTAKTAEKADAALKERDGAQQRFDAQYTTTKLLMENICRRHVRDVDVGVLMLCWTSMFIPGGIITSAGRTG